MAQGLFIPSSARLTGSKKYTRAHVQMGQKPKSLAAVMSFFIMAYLPGWIRTCDGHIGTTTEAHARLAEGTAGPGSPHHHRKLPETFEKAKSGCTKVHTIPAAQKQRENTASLKLGIVQVNI